MNLAAVFHRPMSEYAFAVDENTYVFRLRAQRGDLKRCTLHYADRAAMTPGAGYFSAWKCPSGAAISSMTGLKSR